MIKRYKRTYSGYIRRSSRVYLKYTNIGKLNKLKTFLLLYSYVVNYYIQMFWSAKRFSNSLADKSITNKAVKRFGITASLSQLASKQAQEIVNSQQRKSKNKRRIPIFKNVVVNLDSRFFVINDFKGFFDYVIRFRSGIPNIAILFNKTKHINKFINNNWILSRTIRLGIKNNRIFIDLIYEKPKPAIKEEGKIIGIDLGYRVPLAVYDGENKKLIGTELRDKIQKVGKRRKGYHYFVETELYRYIKQLDLANTKMVVLELLKNVKKNKRGMFSRRVNRLLSMWQYAKVINRLRQICEENGVLLKFKSPYKTSQRCPACGKIDNKNRNADKFVCTSCGFKEHADIVGAMNLRALGLAGVYSLRLLKR